MTTETMTRIGEDYIECICGNAPHLDGFLCSDSDGTVRDGEYGPTPEWDGEHIICMQCGRVAEMLTGICVTQVAVPELVW